MMETALLKKMKLDAEKEMKTEARKTGRTEVSPRHNQVLRKGVLHLLPKISMFCAVSQDNQQLFEK